MIVRKQKLSQNQSNMCTKTYAEKYDIEIFVQSKLPKNRDGYQTLRHLSQPTLYDTPYILYKFSN